MKNWFNVIGAACLAFWAIRIYSNIDWAHTSLLEFCVFGVGIAWLGDYIDRRDR